MSFVEAALYGPFDIFSAFPFENFSGLLKSSIISPLEPLQQIYRRMAERQFLYMKPSSYVV